MSMKILIVEDHPVYVSLLKTKLQETNIPLEIIGVASNISSALNLITDQNPDVLILDVDMGTETSFELFKHIDYRDYEIIFATGYDEYAITAFDLEAIGYLVKPIITSQLEKFLLIAQKNLLIKSTGPESITKEIKALKHSISDTIISVPSDTGFEIVAINTIQRCEAYNSTTQIFLADGKKLVSSYNLGKFYDLLSGKGFLQVHRSHVINLNFVKKYLRSGIIVMQDGTEIPLSKNNRQGFIAIFSATDK